MLKLSDYLNFDSFLLKLECVSYYQVSCMWP